MSSLTIRCFCRAYLMLLHAYPREFRAQFGGDMRQVFRDRCLHVAGTTGRWRWLRFARQSAADWVTSLFQERIMSLRSLSPRECGAKAARAARLMWRAGRDQQPRRLAAEWAMTLIVFLFATTTLVQAYVVPSGSMEGTLRVGDHMLVDRVAYAKPGSLSSRLLPYSSVRRGDIAAFRYPEDTSRTYVKRVIGLPGDRIRLVGKQVWRNGAALVEPYAQHVDPALDPYRDNFPTAPEYATTPRGRDMFRDNVRAGEVTVPPGMLFMLGDNRDNSADSRYWGFVPRGNLVGKPLLIYWSYDAPQRDLEAWSLGHVADVMAHFFTKTRWERTLSVPRSQTAGVSR